MCPLPFFRHNEEVWASPLRHLSFFDAAGRCPPPRYVVFPFFDTTGRGGVHLLGVSSSLFPMRREICISSVPSFRPSTHAKHEKTPTRASFRARRLKSFLRPTTHAEHEKTLVGVFSCSASCLCPSTHAKHETTPTRLSLCVSFLCPTTHAINVGTDFLCSFLGFFLLCPMY